MEERLIAILRLALKYEATDIHFLLKYNEVEILMRIDGIMRKVKSKPDDYRLIRYLQYLANLDVGNLNKPQTGQFEMQVDDSLLSLRFAVVNSFNMTNGVLRILNSNLKVTADNLSSDKAQNDYFKSLLEEENGLVLFAGPTGSGKTTTLYSLLKSVKNKVICTIEDPIEVYHEGFVQIQVNEKQHTDYEEGIKELMRHDPDIIMIGEIRDDKAAKMSLRAANTGHLVLSTIHASSASAIISRMVDLGVNESHLYEMLLALIYQRMIIDKKGRKRVVYEIMDKDEITYFKKYKCHSKDFISVDNQIEKGRLDGIY